jgi:short-subunit dehydrogenase
MHVLVTGAAGAIGRAIAAGFAARHPGVRLTLADVDYAGAATLAGQLPGCNDAEAVEWDLSKPDALPAAVASLTARRGDIDVLVSCAGIMDMRTLRATPWEAGARLLDIDLVSPLRLMSLLVPSMVERRSGCVINVTSMAGVTPLRGCVFYGAAKAGLAMASEVARLELEPQGVRVITVYPGPVRSELERRARAQVPAGLVARFLPTGDAEPLARRVLDAYASGAARVVYPPLYDLANRVPRVAGWITSRLSPMPLE